MNRIKYFQKLELMFLSLVLFSGAAAAACVETTKNITSEFIPLEKNTSVNSEVEVVPLEYSTTETKVLEYIHIENKPSEHTRVEYTVTKPVPVKYSSTEIVKTKNTYTTNTGGCEHLRE